ncbi:hypothetical protein Hypma_003361 [Hypsizygus marmoreus]|uniref:Uncharacterized protein n=1 Tax=Hypsizygus marmoreus TaxID=39966 RepID=A0A369J6V6_HYPMA|nr:hypothetical protein Hypma_003361 [Hypsizygus marmoreus]
MPTSPYAMPASKGDGRRDKAKGDTWPDVDIADDAVCAGGKRECGKGTFGSKGMMRPPIRNQVAEPRNDEAHDLAHALKSTRTALSVAGSASVGLLAVKSVAEALVCCEESESKIHKEGELVQQN